MNRLPFLPAPGWAPALLPLLLALAAPAAAQDVCIRTVSAVPVIDGIVASALPNPPCPADAIWSGVAPGEYQPGASNPTGHLFLAYHVATTTLAVGVTVKGDKDVSDYDYVSLFFDRDNNDAYNDGDFVIRVQAKQVKTDTGSDCDENTGGAAYFVHQGGGWVEVPAPGPITAKLAWDFDPGVDPDKDLWNVELSFNATTFGLPPGGFGIGSFLFIDDGRQLVQVGQVRKWPGSVAATPAIIDIDPSFNAPNPAQLANATLSGTCFDVNFTAANPWKINSAAAQAWENHIVRNADNTFTVTFFYDGPGAAPSPVANTGTVRLTLQPYGTLGTNSSLAWEKTQVAPAGTVNQAYSVTFNFDFANPPAGWATLGTINFICATMTLEGFTRDDNTTNNLLNVNHNEFTTSEYLQPIFISAEGIPGLRPGQSATVLLQVVDRNTGAGGATAGAAPARGGGGRLALGGAGAVLLLAAVLGRRGTRRRAAGTLGVLLLLGMAACPGRGGTGSGNTVTPSGEDRWEFANAAELGLRPLQGEPGWYTVQLRHGETRRLDMRFRGLPLPYEPRRVRLEAARDGRPGQVTVPVKPGQVLAVFASGAVDLDGTGRMAPTSANGFVSPDSGAAWVLRRGMYRPSDYAGALIGSFDSFETAFPVGRSSAIVVPPGVESLTLAVNADRQRVGVMTGGFDLDLVEPPPLRVPTYPLVEGDGTTQAPQRVPTWEVLTSASVYTFYQTESRDREGRMARTRHPLGFAHQVVFDSHERGETQPRARGGQ